MQDPEEQLLRELLSQIYLEIAPEHSRQGEVMIRKLASGLYARGGRVLIGAQPKREQLTIFVSCDPKDLIVWTCKNWHRIMGLPPHSSIGKSIYNYLSGGTGAFRREFWMPALLRDNRVGPFPATLVTASGDFLVGTTRSEALRESDGAFKRTFTRIQVALSYLLPLLLSAA